MIRLAKKLLRPARDGLRSRFIEKKLKTRVKNRAHVTLDSFTFDDLKRDVIAFVRSSQVDETHYLYKYSASCTKPTLYASAYALMTLSLLGELEKRSNVEKEEWRNYFDSYQSEVDGLFYDPAVQNDIFNDSDWWGARHLAIHMISAYTDLGYRPKYPFVFLDKYCKATAIEEWLNQFDWQSAAIGTEDVDNKIMNIGCLLQYQRDIWNDNHAGGALACLKNILRERINPAHGMWGGFDFKKPDQRSRMVQFAYHLFQIFFYDGDFDFDVIPIAEHVLATQNALGGYGVRLNSSACEDMDSIDLLIRLSSYLPPQTQERVRLSLEKGWHWVLVNQVHDGGFVFRLEESFCYGARETSSITNQGALFPTWFRTLSLAYLARYLGARNSFSITRCAGYEFL